MKNITFIALFFGILYVSTHSLAEFSKVEYARAEEETVEEVEEKTVLIGIRWSEEGIKNLIRKTFPENPELFIKIAQCESSLIPHAYNAKTNDTGVFQINDYYHGERLNELGLDPLDVQDNLTYARMLYEESGVQPWSASRKCWYN